MTTNKEPGERPEDVVLQLAADYPITMSFDLPSPDLDPTMFFDIPAHQRTADTPVDEFEYNYAIAINRGRQMIATRHPDDGKRWERVIVDREYRTAEEGFREETYAYYDAISDILQAADFAGWDPAQLVLMALRYQQGEKRYALDAAASQSARSGLGRAVAVQSFSGQRVRAIAADSSHPIEASQHYLEEIEIDVDVFGTRTEVVVFDGEDWRANVPASIAENIDLGLGLDSVSATVGRRPVHVYEDDDRRIHVSRIPEADDRADSRRCAGQPHPDAERPSPGLEDSMNTKASPAGGSTARAIQPGPCSCECRGCEDNTYHCFKSSTGCGWRPR